MYMKNFILNLSVILIISCGPKNSKSTEEILATNDYTLIQKRKGEIKSQINDLKFVFIRKTTFIFPSPALSTFFIISFSLSIEVFFLNLLSNQGYCAGVRPNLFLLQAKFRVPN